MTVRLAGRGRARISSVGTAGLSGEVSDAEVHEVRHAHRLVGARELLAAFLWLYDGLARARAAKGGATAVGGPDEAR
jgi:hypothetical protein